MEEERLVMSGFREEEDDQESSLRPKTLREYVGQQAVKDSLNIYIQAARQRRDSLDHILLYGPPGLGKTTLAGIVASEMGQNIRVTSGPTGIRAHEYPPYRRADMQDYPLTARQCRVYFFASSSKGLAAIISVTAVNIINTPSMMRGVSCSPNTATPKNRAVTGSNAPKMAAGVEPML